MNTVRAYLKTRPEEKGIILRVYETDSRQKRLEVSFNHGTIDADANDFEILVENKNTVLEKK